MPFTLDASVHVMLPDDPVQMAEALGKIASAWVSFVDKLPTDAERHYGLSQTRAKPQSNKRAPRKPKLVEQPATPELVA